MRLYLNIKISTLVPFLEWFIVFFSWRRRRTQPNEQSYDYFKYHDQLCQTLNLHLELYMSTDTVEWRTRVC